MAVLAIFDNGQRVIQISKRSLLTQRAFDRGCNKREGADHPGDGCPGGIKIISTRRKPKNDTYDDLFTLTFDLEKLEKKLCDIAG